MEILILKVGVWSGLLSFVSMSERWTTRELMCRCTKRLGLAEHGEEPKKTMHFPT